MRPSLSERTEWLRKSPLLEGLPEEDLAALARILAAKAYEAGEALFREGDEATGFHLIVEGQVKVSRFGADGREQVVHLLGPSSPCGEVPAFAGGRYPATAEALGAAKTLFLPRDGFLDLGRRNPQILLGMLAVLSRRLRGLVELVDDLALKDVTARLARHLLQLAEEQGGTSQVRLPTSKAVLASRLGTIAETLSRTLARMQGLGFIAVSGRTVELQDIKSLRALAEGRKP